MRTIKIITTAILASGLSFIACQQEELNETTTSINTQVEAPSTLLTYSKVVNMLQEYDKTRIGITENGLGFENTRVNTFPLTELKEYISYTEDLAKEKNITLTGFSLIKGVHTESTASKQKQIGQESLLYAPSAMINDKEAVIDILNSEKGAPLSLKESLKSSGYQWRYDKDIKTNTSASKKAIKNLAIGSNTSSKTAIAETTTNVKKMLETYDDTLIDATTKALGFEDSRIYTFDIVEFKKYLAYIENEARLKDITLSGISFVKGVYNKETAHEKKYIGYENLMYLPTTIINGEEVLIDLANSTKDNIVSFKEILASNGYEWLYDGPNNTYNKTGSKESLNQIKYKNSISSVANRTGITPPLDEKI